MTQTITLPFQTPADIEKAAQFIASLSMQGVSFEADRDGVAWIVIKITA